MMERCTVCAECGQPNMDRVALTEIVKTYEIDECDAETTIVFEQLWHRECYRTYDNRISGADE